MSLPSYDDSFFGRRLELQRMTDQLGASRLIVLSGAGGIGKTRLAVTWVWARCRARQSQNATMVRLGDVGDQLGDMVRQLRVPTGWDGAEGRWLARTGVHSLIVDGGRPALAPLLEAWLAEAPELVIVVTSREVWRDHDPLGVLSPEDARRLFIDRAPRKLSPAQLDDVLPRLEGLPLSIELAAARLEVLSLKMLSQRLQAPLSLLRDPDGDGPHASLRRVIALSWSLLEPHEQEALAQCSAFVGSIPLDAAESVLVLPPDAPSVLDVIHSLVRRSLLRRLTGDEENEARFIMFDVISVFAREQLSEVEEVEARHGQWYERQLQVWTDDGFHRGLEAAQRMDRDHDNLQAVVQRAMASGEMGRALRAAIALRRSPRADVEIHRVISRAEADSVDECLLGRARLSWATVLRGQGRLDEALEQHQLVLDSARRHSDRRLEGHALGGMGNLWSLKDQPDRAEACFQAALQIADALEDARLQALALNALSSAVDLRRDGDTEAALRKRQRALRLVSAIGDVYYQTWLYARVAGCLLDLGRYDDALTEAQAGLTLSLASGQNTCSTYEMMARIHLLAGRLDEAEAAALKSIHAWQDVYADPRVGCVPSWQVLALRAIEQEQLDDARRWLQQTLDVLGPRARYVGVRRLSEELLAGTLVLMGGPVAPSPRRRRRPSALPTPWPWCSGAP